MRRTRMIRILLEHSFGQRRGERLAAKARVARTDRAEQREGVEDRNLVVVRPLTVHLFHRSRVRLIARELVARGVEQAIDRFHERFFFGRLRLGQPAFQGRRQPAERGFRGLDIDLRPKWMVVAHRFAPIGERETWIRLLRFFECNGRFVELEAVKILDALDERRLRSGGAGGRKVDRAKLRRLSVTGPRQKPDAGERRSNRNRKASSHVILRPRNACRGAEW